MVMKTNQIFKCALIILLCLLFAQSADAVNLVDNPGFESGTDGWFGMGCPIDINTAVFHGGTQCGYAYNRTATWNGLAQSLLTKLESGKSYNISAWVMLENSLTGSEPVRVTFMKTDDSGTSYSWAGSVMGINGVWTRLTGSYTLTVSGSLAALNMYFEGPSVDVNYYLDDVEVAEAGDWKADANDRIEKIRKQTATILVLDPLGNPVENVGVQIEQLRHSFAFGSCLNYRILTDPNYANFFKNTFEWAVLENESKWPSNEPSQGNVNYFVADYIYNWCTDNNIPMRGHCLFWEQQGSNPAWVQALAYAPYPNPSPLLTAINNRLDSAVNHFKDKFLHWDIDNEQLPSGSDYQFFDRLEVGGPGSADVNSRVWMYQRANQIDPNCILFVNEYSGNSFGGYEAGPYINLVNKLRDKGAPVHAVGVQAHLPDNFNRILFMNVLDDLATLGLPIWLTEFDTSQADPDLRASELEDLYRIAFSNPAVEGVLMWGFWENSHWRPNWYIVDANWVLNEAGRKYQNLMNEWTTNDSNTTDSAGSVNFRGFHGSYRITLTASGKNPEVKSLELNPQQTPPQFVFQLQNAPPIADAGPDQVACAFFNGDAYVDLDGSASSDDYTENLTFNWSWTIGVSRFNATGVSPTIELPLGMHTIQLIVNDGLVDSEPAYVNINVVESIQGTLKITPQTISRKRQHQSITATLQLPQDISKDQIDISTGLLLYPGQIEASGQRILPQGAANNKKQFSVSASFDIDELLDAVGDNGPTDLYVVGRLKSGQCFYASDSIKIISPGH
jgi:endo-1,4-beta-xylanase